MKKTTFFSFVFFLVAGSLSGQCPFTPTIEPDGLVLCYYEQDTLWTQEYDAYQWFRDGAPIPGANDPVYVPVESGSYTVEVEDENQCNGISDPFEFVINSLAEKVGKDLEWRVFPNPATDRVQIRYSSSTPASAELFNSLGERLMSKELSGGTASFLLNNLPDGIYWIRLQAEGRYAWKKLSTGRLAR